ncbi:MULTISPECIES: hypothetical protein [unclassified Microcoleus]|uniref:hypothetical protein n=1 Tax=unclassified Microcoleus TaxID=2642155 RepID=UPI002FD0AF59
MPSDREHLTFAVKLEIGVLRPEARGCEERGRRKEEEGKRKKEGARRSVFTNMRCSPSGQVMESAVFVPCEPP